MQFLKANARRVVVKIGTNTLTHDGGRLNTGRIDQLCQQIAAMRTAGLEVVVVSSGAVGTGMGALGLDRRPTCLATLQACAAVGQSRLVQAWQLALEKSGHPVAQVLLTREDVRGRRRHVAVRETLEQLIKMGVVPIVNENDTVSADEIRFGDNDVLSALTASLLKADLLVILSTIPGLLDRTRENQLVPLVEKIDDAIRSLAGGTDSPTAVGGMVTKIDAAAIATQSGCGTFIGSGENPNILTGLMDGTAEGTFFVPSKLPLAARKRWIAYFEKPKGSLVLDDGACSAVSDKGSSLLATGITDCRGSFETGDVVNLLTPQNKVFARGISHFPSDAIQSILGLDSAAIKKQFPEKKRTEVIHRDSLVLLT